MHRIKIVLLALLKIGTLLSIGALLAAIYLKIQNAPLKRVTEEDISYMEIQGSEISYTIDLYNSVTGSMAGSISDKVYFDERLNFDLFYVPCDKEIGDLCEGPVFLFWARYINKKEPIPVRSSTYFTEDGSGHMPPDHPYFQKLKKKVLERFCKLTEFCSKEKSDGFGFKVPHFYFD